MTVCMRVRECVMELLTTNEATPHSSKVVRRDETALLDGIGRDAIFTNFGHLDEARSVADGAHDTLIITCEVAECQFHI